MNRLYVQLGRAGDILNFLPLLYRDFKAGEKPGLMVSKDYENILDGTSYVEKVSYPGPHIEVSRACAVARATCEKVICTQVNGPAAEILECTYRPAGQANAFAPSFDEEAWKVAGRAADWNICPPLVFDRRDSEREQALLSRYMAKGKKYLLLSTGGKSSPFPHADLLAELVRLKAKTMRLEVIDLGTIKAERIYDLLALYDKAVALVSTDSAPLHLARACPNLPVFAFTNDKPLLWNGSAWQPNHVFYCRYGDFKDRIGDFLASLQALAGDVYLSGSQVPVVVWNSYQSGGRVPSGLGVLKPLPVTIGVCGRDSSILGDDKRMPMLKDCVLMGLKRAGEHDPICVVRPDVFIEADAIPHICQSETAYAYRMEQNGNGHKTFRPYVDMFCAAKAWWKKNLAEIPDLVLGNDYFWSQALWMIFQHAKAKDLTGFVYRQKTDPKPIKPEEAPKRYAWNLRLATEVQQRLKIAHRYPRVSEQVEMIPLETGKLFARGYNPTIIRRGEEILICYRYHVDSLATRLAMARIDQHWGVSGNAELPVNGYSIEDPKFWTLGPKLMMSWVESYFPIKIQSSVRYGEFVVGELKEIARPKYGMNDGDHVEKNWVFFEHSTGAMFIYQCGENHVVVRWTGKMEEEYVTPGPHWPYGAIKGGTPPLPYEGKLLRFFHSTLDNEVASNPRRYYIGAYLMDPNPPFKVERVSKKPIIYGSEIDDLTPDERRACRHWKQNVVFASGVVEDKDSWLLSLGVNDCQCVIARVTPENLNL